MDTITFNGVKYPVRLVDMKEFGKVYVGVESMEDAIFNDGCDLINEEAETVDSQIFFYVPDEIIEDEGKVISYLNRHLDEKEYLYDGEI